MKIANRVLSLTATLMLAVAAMQAQGTRGTIKGIVTDANGAAVSGASVKLTDVAKEAVIRTVQTDTSGAYQFVEVEPATYNVTVTATNFSESKLVGIKVEPNRNLQVDAVLKVSGVSEEVVISSSQEMIDRESATLGTTVDRRRVQDLPLNGRNVLQLAQLQPGVVPAAGGLGIRVNGGRNVENNITLDGANNNEVAVGGSTGSQPRPDAVQEFRLLTSNFEAEFGRNSGSVINVVVKSGANDFHGNVRTFYRPTFLSAARYFDQDSITDRVQRGPQQCKRAGGSTTGPDCDFRRPFERKEFGGNIGGPIYFPRIGLGGPSIYKGKNRAFFFVDYEGRRQLIGDTRTLSGLPSADERNGIFTSQLDDAGNPILLQDPTTGAPFPVISGPVVNGVPARQQIPTSRFSPIANYYLQFLPTPDASGRASVGANTISDLDQLTTRLDFYITEKQNLSGTYNYFTSTENAAFAFGGANVPGFGANNLRTTQNYVVRHAWTISPTLVNSLLVGYARNNQPGVAPQNSTTPAQIGFTADFVANDQFAGPPFVTLDNRGINLGNSIQGPQARVTENFQIQDSVSYVRGDHRFKFGFDGTLYKQDQTFLFVNQGILSFDFTNEGNTTGDDFADLLIGNTPASIQFGDNGLRDNRQKSVAGFVQDSWRVKDNFTLTLGLRYEYVSPLTDKFNRVAYYRPGSTSQLLTSGQLRTMNGTPITVPVGERAPLGLVYVGDPDPVLGGTVPDGGVQKDLNNFSPRVGIAYTANPSGGFLQKLLGNQQTVIRSGFGVFYGAVIGDTVLQQLNAPGFNGTNSFFQSPGGTLANPFGPDPFPNYIAPGSGRDNITPVDNPFEANAFNVSAPLSTFSRATDPRIRTPYTLQYNLTIERGFGRDYVATVSYVGNRGVKLYALEQLNPALGTFFATPAGRTIPDPAQGNANARRANDDIQGGIDQMVSAGNSHYHSFQAQLQKRFSNGLVFQTAYTFSKSISDSDQLRSNLDLLDRSLGRGLSADDIPHRFVTSALYDLPFARNANGIFKTLFGGFGVGGIVTFQSGTPFSVNNPSDTVGTGGGILSFADLGAPFTYADPRETDSRAFNIDAFRSFNVNLAQSFRRGTSGPNQFRARNGINNWDLILSKKTPLGSEVRNLELRFEAFNAFNHTQFGPEAGTTGSGIDLNLNNVSRGTFGKFISAREARVIQLGARISF
jgi:carboxypeptidase family protein/TonB-dependent receptor-like protein